MVELQYYTIYHCTQFSRYQHLVVVTTFESISERNHLNYCRSEAAERTPPTLIIYSSYYYYGGAVLNRTYGTHENQYISLILLTIFGPAYYGPP